MKIAVPAHITGFFYPVIKENPIKSGSLGAGFSIAKYVFTTVKFKDSSNLRIRIFFNGIDRTMEARTSLTAAKEILERAEIFRGEFIVSHEFQVPIGCGLSSSGAGALGVVFGINEVLDLGFSREELARIAHISEVKQRTGLGSVIAQYDGMFEIRLSPGAPGIGRVLRIPKDWEVLILVWERIETPTMLASKDFIKKVQRAFSNKLVKLTSNPTLTEFVKLSRDFSEKIGLMNNTLAKALSLFVEKGYQGSMLMIGRGIFLIREEFGERINFKEVLRKLNTGKIKYFACTKMENFGVRIIG